jgi:ribose 5-phosphate isomerase B
MALNKAKGVRAALVHNLKGAKFSRLHNNANVLVLGSDFVKGESAKKIVSVWIKTEFEAGRHSRRVNQISKIEQGNGL